MILLAQQKTIPKIICDHTLEDTAHWLRAAGYDVEMPINTLSDTQLVDMAQTEGRILIINERSIKAISHKTANVIRVKSSLVYDQLKEVSENIGIDWLYRPFSRCMICNTDLVKLNINQWLNLHESIQRQCVTSHGCPSCNRIYWAGEQINKMVGQLEVFKKSMK